MLNRKFYGWISICLFGVLLTSSCSKKQEQTQEPWVQNSSIIVGQIDWESITRYEKGHPFHDNAKGVGKLSIPAISSRCVAFMISPNIALTNQHCIEERSWARGATITFNQIEGVPSSQYKKAVCDEFIGNNFSLDYALLRCKGSPGNSFGQVRLSTERIQVDDDIYIIHQNCDYHDRGSCVPNKLVSTGVLNRVDGDRLRHSADTLGGSSGSPIFSKRSNNVIGLHNSGFGDHNDNGRGTENGGIPMSEIIKDIKQKWPNLKVNIDDSPTIPSDPQDPADPQDPSDPQDPADPQDPNDPDDPPRWDLNMEPNDTWSQAYPLWDSSKVVLSNNISNSSDIDIYKFKMDYITKVKFKLYSKSWRNHYRYEIYDSQKRVLGSGTSKILYRVKKLTLYPGTYYIKIESRGRDKGTYKMTLSK